MLASQSVCRMWPTARLFESVIEMPSTRTLLVRTGPPAMETWEFAFWSCMRPIFGLATNSTVCASLAVKNELRPRMGRSVIFWLSIFWLSIAWPVEASPVSSKGASAVTAVTPVTPATYTVSAEAAGIAGALLVAPPWLSALETCPEELRGFLPIPIGRLPFQSLLVASENDPYLPIEIAMRLARSWGSEFVNAGRQGHINIASGHGPWPAGERLLEGLCEAGGRDRPGCTPEPVRAPFSPAS